MTILIYDYSEDMSLEEEEDLNPLAVRLELPSRTEVCDRCHGKGVHDHPAFHNGFTGEDFAEDPDFFEEYMRGVYDVVCTVCKGRNVVEVVDENRCSDEQLDYLFKYYKEESAYFAECEAERRAGA